MSHVNSPKNEHIFDTYRPGGYDARLMTGALPATIDPYRLAEQSARLKGGLLLAKLPRLRELCTNEDGQLEADLAFSRSGLGLAKMAGSITASVGLSCQRCLGPMVLNLALAVQVYFQYPDDERELAQDFDTVRVDEHANLHRILEDELLLALPMIPMHEPAQCPAAKYIKQETDTGATKNNPFAVLEKFKGKR